MINAGSTRVGYLAIKSYSYSNLRILIGIEVVVAAIVILLLWSQNAFAYLAYIGLGETVSGIVSFKDTAEYVDNNGNEVINYNVLLALLKEDSLSGQGVGGGAGYLVSAEDYDKVHVNDYVEGKITGKGKMQILKVVPHESWLNTACLEGKELRSPYCFN